MHRKLQTVLLREGAITGFAAAIEYVSAKRIMFVVDEAAYEACGVKRNVEAVLSAYRVARFSGFEPNPKLPDIERGIAVFRREIPDVIISLGGGSAIDMAKLIGLLAVQESDAREIICGRKAIHRDAVPSLAIPTTAGTGSEATHFAVAYVDGEKHSVAHHSLRPDYVLVDPQLTYRMPPSITAASGLDAFCQAVESMWAVGATDESLEFARVAMQLAWEHLPQSVTSPTPASRLGMCTASHLAGNAINISKTTSCHAISYFLTSQYNIPHGMAVATTLSTMLAFNAEVTAEDCIDVRGPTYVRARIAEIVEMLGCHDIEEACRSIDRFIAGLNCPCSLASAGITQCQQLEAVVNSVDALRMSNNPRKISTGQLLKVLSEARVDTDLPTMLSTEVNKARHDQQRT